MVMPDISQVMLLFAGYLLGLVAIRLWFSPKWRNKQEKQDDIRPEFRPRPKYPRYGVPRRTTPPSADRTNPPNQP